MNNLVWFLIGIIGNIIAAYLYDNMRGKGPDSPPIILIRESTPERRRPPPQVSKRDQRAINRRLARNAILNFVLFIFRFIMLGVAIYYPLILAQGISNTLDLSVGNITGIFSSADISKSDLLLPSIVLLIVLFIPLLILGDWILNRVRKLYDKFWPVDDLALMRMRLMIFLAISILIAGIVTYSVTDMPFLLALSAPVIFLLIVVAFALR